MRCARMTFIVLDGVANWGPQCLTHTVLRPSKDLLKQLLLVGFSCAAIQLLCDGTNSDRLFVCKAHFRSGLSAGTMSPPDMCVLHGLLLRSLSVSRSLLLRCLFHVLCYSLLRMRMLLRPPAMT